MHNQLQHIHVPYTLAVVAVLAVVALVWLVYELKTAPECYYDKQGNFHRIEWFEQNNKTDEMFYDFEGREPFPYDLFYPQGRV